MTRHASFPLYTGALCCALSFYLPPLLGASSLPWVLPLLLLFYSLMAALILSFLPRHRSQPWAGAFRAAALLAAAGLALGFCCRLRLAPGLRWGLPEERVGAIRGILSEDPRTLAGSRGMGRIELRGASSRGALSVRSSASGNIAVIFPESTLDRLKNFGRGSEMEVGGVLLGGKERKPLFIADSVHVYAPPPAWERTRSNLRLKLMNVLSKHDWGGLAAALLLGIRDNLDTDLAQSYRRAGCSHVLALSGMHLGVLSGLIALLLKPTLGLQVSSILGAILVSFYIMFIGSQASLNRAALMYLLGIFALLRFLPRRPLALLALSFLIQISLSPSQGESPSFILSYLALGAIMILGEPLSYCLKGTLPTALASPLSASLGAFILTMGYTASVFGSLYPMGILASLIIVPLTTVFMLLSLLHLALPLGALGSLLSLLYRLLEQVVGLAGSLPGIEVHRPALALLISILLGLTILLLGRTIKTRRNRVHPFAL